MDTGGDSGCDLPRPSSTSLAASSKVGLEPGTLQEDRLTPRVPRTMQGTRLVSGRAVAMPWETQPCVSSSQ